MHAPNGRYVFLVNPAAGGGHGARLAKAIGPALESLGVPASAHAVKLTTFPTNHDTVRELAAGARAVVAVGGDGTASELVGAVLAVGPSCALGVIPVGTGNDLARVTGTHAMLARRGLRAVLRALLRGRTRPLDVWRVGDRYMTNYLSLGLDAAVAAGFHARRRLGLFPTGSVLGNKAAYALCALGCLDRRIGASRAELTLADGGLLGLDLRDRCALILANIPSYGGGARPARGVRPDDGLLQATLVRSPLGLGGMFLVRYLLPWGMEAYASRLESLAVRKATLRVSGDEFLQVDGEPRLDLAGGSLTIEHVGAVRALHVLNRLPVSSGSLATDHPKPWNSRSEMP